MATTPRLGLDIPQAAENISSYPSEAAQSLGILDNAVTYTQGTLASRPTAGLAGREYRATDTSQWFKDDGTAWQLIQVGYPARGYRNGALSISASTVTAVAIDTVTVDAAGAFTAGNYKAPAPGAYQISGMVSVNVSAASSVYVSLTKNTSTTVSTGCIVGSSGAGGLTSNVSDIVVLAVNDTITLNVFSFASATLAAGSAAANYLAVVPLF